MHSAYPLFGASSGFPEGIRFIPCSNNNCSLTMPLRSTTTTSCRINATCPSHRSTRSVPRLPSSIRSLAEQDQCSFRRRAAKDYIVDRCTSALCGDFDADALVRGGPANYCCYHTLRTGRPGRGSESVTRMAWDCFQILGSFQKMCYHYVALFYPSPCPLHCVQSTLH